MMTLSEQQQDILQVSILGQESIYIGTQITEFVTLDILSTCPSSTYCIFLDYNVGNLHLQHFLDSFNRVLSEHFADNISNSPKLLHFLLPPGESTKTRETKARIEDWLLENKCTRDTCIIALGGGVIGDLVGFVAATFMRGVSFIQVPTTLLAMVDSSVGGKTAVDTIHGKNLIGSFHQPKRVYIDTRYLSTLPKREFINGMAEIIKTAAIRSESDFELLENHPERILALCNNSSPSEQEEYLLKQLIMGSVKVKAEIVSLDEKEGGLRGLLNFGHSIGHAIEAILSPQVLHGECVAIGMIREAEIARHMGFLNDMSVGRLLRCIQAYGLPISVTDKKITSLVPHKKVSVDSLLDFMCIDKKNQGHQKRIVMLSGIGKTMEPRATYIPDAVIRKILCPSIAIVPPTKSLQTHDMFIRVPGSKSISNRALVLAALGEGTCRLHGLLHSDDVQVMLDALHQLVGITYSWEKDGAILVIHGGGGRLHVPHSEIYLGNAGTASRFLTTVVTLIRRESYDPEESTEPHLKKEIVLTGNARMKQRPIGDLVNALQSNSCQIEYMESKGSLPLKITPTSYGLRGGIIELEATTSSQYVSSILMAAPYANDSITLCLTGGDPISQPYIDMTLSMMESFGIQVDRVSPNTYTIPLGIYQNPPDYYIEADASSATYPLAFAAITGSSVTVTNIGHKSLQGDAAFAVKVLREMGCAVEQSETSTTVTGPPLLKAIPSIDMETMTDAFLTASVLAAVAIDGSSNVTTITGIANQRVKECNRIAAMKEQLERFGVESKELPDGIQIHGIDPRLLKVPVGGVKCYDDHRIAMSFSILSCILPKELGYTVIHEKKCVEKTWPSWWDSLENILKVNLSGMEESGDQYEEQQEKKQTPVSSNASIVLIGMRGAGKTRMGKALSESLSRPFIDLDEYLEVTLSKSIPDIIKQEGWNKFREYELEILKNVLTHSSKNHVISCGGGVVETADARDLLVHAHSSLGCLVVHIKRNIQNVIAYLEVDKTRPSYGQDIEQVWNTRKQWYHSCSNLEFVIEKQEDSWTQTLGSFKRMISHRLSQKPLSIPQNSYFISFTFQDIKQIKGDLMDYCSGVNAVELRVDLLESLGEDFVAEQVSLIRKACPLPIIFTVRTVAQGGKFPNDQMDRMLSLISCGIRWGCEFVDVQVTDFIPTFQSQLQEILKSKQNSQIIASFHNLDGSIHWSSGSSGETMQDIYDLMYPWADIIKLIGVAKDLKDNFECLEFVSRQSGSKKPLIALNMGSLGQLSRALNTFMTPVTHSLLTLVAAPGQLSVKEIHRLRHNIGLLKARNYYLFGFPIKQSMSPTLHNTGFEELGLPNKYSLFESTDAKQVFELIQNDLEFGGASVTIPLKEVFYKEGSFVRISESVRKIGALNTITYDSELKGLSANNTDWLGMKGCIESAYSKSTSYVGIVIGAGGTARAACYALSQLEGVNEIRIWNRTIERARGLALEFNCVIESEWQKLMHSSDDKMEFIVISTIPAQAQESISWDSFLANHSGIIVDMAYRPRETLLLKAARKKQDLWKCVEGIQVLLEQGYYQFEEWTGLLPPRRVIQDAVLKSYSSD